MAAARYPPINGWIVGGINGGVNLAGRLGCDSNWDAS